MTSPSQLMALRKMVEASASLEVQFDKDASRRPLLFVLKKARDAAAQAMDALIYECAPEDINTVRQLQHEIRRYDDLVAWCRQIIIEGKSADYIVSEFDREDFAKAVLGDGNDEDQSAAANGPMENY